MLLARHCVSIWRQVSGAAVKQFCSGSLASLGTEESVEQIRSKIFGTHIGNGLRSGRKVLRKKLNGDRIASWYPEPVAKYDPMFVDMNIERYASLFVRLIYPSTAHTIYSHEHWHVLNPAGRSSSWTSSDEEGKHRLRKVRASARQRRDSAWRQLLWQGRSMQLFQVCIMLHDSCSMEGSPAGPALAISMQPHQIQCESVRIDRHVPVVLAAIGW